MQIRLSVTLGLACTVLIPLAGQAGEYIPAQRLTAEKTIIESHATDYLGLVPGLTLAEFSKVAQASFKDAQLSLEETKLSKQVGNETLSTPRFANHARLKRKDSALEMNLRGEFSGPASGNQLIGYDLALTYDKWLESPDVSKVVNFLGRKYGEPSQLTIEGEVLQMSWIYKDKALIKCSFLEPCQVPPVEYLTDQLAQYQSPNVDFIATAEVERRADSPALVGTFRIKMIDLNKRMRAAKADADTFADVANVAAAGHAN